MAKVLDSFSRMNFPSEDMLSNMADDEQTRTTSPIRLEAESPEAVKMLMRSMAKLNGSSSVTSLSTMGSSPRGSPRASQNDLLTMGYETFENGIAMNTGSKSGDNLVAMAELDNRMNVLRIQNENVALEVMRRLLLAVERFLDVDGDGTHFLVC